MYLANFIQNKKMEIDVKSFFQLAINNLLINVATVICIS